MVGFDSSAGGLNSYQDELGAAKCVCWGKKRIDSGKDWNGTTVGRVYNIQPNAA